MIKKILITVLFISCFVNCTTDDEQVVIDDTVTIVDDKLLIGHWSNATYDKDKITFNRVDNLDNEEYGVSFLNTNDFKMKTSGWCGTPPLSFYIVEGNYEQNDDIIEVRNVNDYNSNYNWKIISLTKDELVVTYVPTEQENDYNALMALYNEFESMANIACKDSSEWTYTAYGSKACGGPQGYIAYPTSINVTAFLAKVTLYTQLEDAYNIKWGIISTCDLPQEPKTVDCIDGLPILNYN